MGEPDRITPGQPGIPPRWTSSAKQGVGTALSASSRVWFTLSHGILNEVYYGRIDQACIRDLGLLVTDGQSFCSEEKRHTTSEVTWLADGAPGFRVVNLCHEGRYRIEKEVISDPAREVVLMRVRFVPLLGELGDYRVFALLAPHLGNRGCDNSGWLGDHNGAEMLLASSGALALALASDAPWRVRSVGYVGFSDGWQQLTRDYLLSKTYERAEHGNIALTGELQLPATGEFVLSLGFGRTSDEAASRAAASLFAGFDRLKARYLHEWTQWQQGLEPLAPPSSGSVNLFRTSAAMIRAHDAKEFPGGIIASLSIPWGLSKGDDDLGGYHLVWPRDLVEAAGGLLAAGAHEEALDVLEFLETTQQADGHWPQNMWLDGTPYWNGIQMDETALPILLVDLAHRAGALAAEELPRFWPMVRRAAQFLVANGPVTQQDRWEEDPGYNPFTLAAEVAALLVAADLADDNDELQAAQYLRETADLWNGCIERWTYAQATDIAREHEIDGYYVRIAPPETSDASSPIDGFVAIKNRPLDDSLAPATQIVGTDFLALVRFGLRAADDPRIIDTVKVVDRLLQTELPQGPGWHRYTCDGYGEHDDGTPFDGTGRGRVWPLFTGERGHYELAAGRPIEAEQLLATFAALANAGGLLPEQTWDAADIPERGLVFGAPAGSAMPLVWAHAEYLKLLRSLRDGRVFDLPPQTVARYLVEQQVSPHHVWRFNHKCRRLIAGKTLRVELREPAVVHWGINGWQSPCDAATRDTALGVHLIDLPTADLDRGTVIDFTFYWSNQERWEGVDYSVVVES